MALLGKSFGALRHASSQRKLQIADLEPLWFEGVKQ